MSRVMSLRELDPEIAQAPTDRLLREAARAAGLAALDAYRSKEKLAAAVDFAQMAEDHATDCMLMIHELMDRHEPGRYLPVDKKRRVEQGHGPVGSVSASDVDTSR